MQHFKFRVLSTIDMMKQFCPAKCVPRVRLPLLASADMAHKSGGGGLA